MYLAFNFSIVVANIELSIRETARHQTDRAVCGHVGISELSLPHRSTQYASLSYKSTGENMWYAFGNSFSMLSGFFGLNRSTIQTQSFRFTNYTSNMTVSASITTWTWKIFAFTFRENSEKYVSTASWRSLRGANFFSLKSVMSALCQWSRYSQTPRCSQTATWCLTNNSIFNSTIIYVADFGCIIYLRY